MFRKFIATTAFAGIALVGVTSTGAFAATETPKDPAAVAAKIAERCAKAPEAIAKIKAAEAKVAERVTKLEAAQAKATAAGKTALADKIGDRIAKLKDRAAKGVDKLAKIEAKVAEKCPAV